MNNTEKWLKNLEPDPQWTRWHRCSECHQIVLDPYCGYCGAHEWHTFGWCYEHSEWECYAQCDHRKKN